MSSSPTGPTSTIVSSTCSPSLAEGQRRAQSVSTGIIACGAIAQPIGDIVARRRWPVDVHPLPPLLHNHPERIAGDVERLILQLRNRYARMVIGYADCGSYGALDQLCDRFGIERLPGLHCYDVFGGADRVAAMMEAQPGTYLLTDFLVRSFARTVLAELGLDRHLDLRDAYFGHYTRVVWLAQDPDEGLRAAAQSAASTLGLPLTTIEVGDAHLEASLSTLLGTPISARS